MLKPKILQGTPAPRMAQCGDKFAGLNNAA